MSDEKAETPYKGQDFHHDTVQRRVSFNWERAPLPWIPDKSNSAHVTHVSYVTPVAHVVKAPHLLLPADGGEAVGPQSTRRLRHSPKEHNKAMAKGLLSTWRELGSAIPRCFKRSCHPSQKGSLWRAVDHLATFPPARAAAGPIGRRIAL